MNLLLFFRDLIKQFFLYAIQIYVRLFCIKREYPSSIHITARLEPKIKRMRARTLVLQKKSFIEQHSIINSTIGDVVVGENSGVGINSIIIGPVKVGRNVRIAQNCFISGENRVKESSGQLSNNSYDIRPVEIGDNVWVGAGSIILPGVTIGANSIIGAGAVVTKDIEKNSLAVGNPAIVKKKFMP